MKTMTRWGRAMWAGMLMTALMAVGCGGLLGEDPDAGPAGGDYSDRNCPVETTYGGFVLASYRGQIHEYTRDGLLIRRMGVPEPALEVGELSGVLGLAIDDCGGLYVSRASQSGWMSMRRPGTGFWEHFESATFRPQNTALAISGTHVYAASFSYVGTTDQIAAFRISDGERSDIAESLEVAALAVSPDGTLYARAKEDGRTVYVIDLDAPGSARVLTLDKEVGGIAVSWDGDLYGSHHGVIYRFRADGSVADSLEHGFDGYGDIDVDRRGNVAAVAAHKIILTDTLFAAHESFDIQGASRLALTGRAWALD